MDFYDFIKLQAAYVGMIPAIIWMMILSPFFNYFSAETKMNVLFDSAVLFGGLLEVVAVTILLAFIIQ